MTAPVFIVDDSTLSCALSELTPGMSVVLSGPEARHAVTVRRLRQGERVDLVDGAGTRIIGVVGAIQPGTKDSLPVDVHHIQEDEDSAASLTLIQALAKGGRDEQAVETATEVGVHCVIPWQAGRSISQWNGNKITKGQARWQSIAREAAKQARRSVTPDVLDLKTTKQLCAWIREQTQGGTRVALLHEEATTPISQFAHAPSPTDSLTDGHVSLAVIVGPEGGIGQEETQALITAGATMVRLGPHVMRTASAGPVALAILAQRAGLWESA